MAIKPGIRWQVLERDEFTCQYCGAKAPSVKLEVDHLIPQSKGGKDELSNFVTACHTCNLGKGDKELEYQDRQLHDDFEYVFRFYTNSPAEAIKMIRVAKHDALQKLIEEVDTLWRFTIWESAKVMLASNFELYILASRYDMDFLRTAMIQVAEELTEGKFRNDLHIIIARINAYAGRLHFECYGTNERV